MNNSIFSKNKIASKITKYTNGTNFNDLSATSDAFMTDIKTNFYMKGGNSCPCQEAIEAFDKNNIDLALYIINKQQCCLACHDKKGNSIIHNLILCTKTNPKCETTLDNLIKANKINENCIDIQNNDGETPILLAAKNELFDIVRKLDEQGANKEIKDKKGFYIGEKDSDDSESSECSQNSLLDTFGSLFSSETHKSTKSIQSVGDTEGIYNLNKIFNYKNDISDIKETLDDSIFESGKQEFNKCITDYFKTVMKQNNGKEVDATIQDTNKVLFLPIRPDTVGINSDIEPDSQKPNDIIFNPFDGLKDKTATDVEPEKELNMNIGKNEEVSDTDKLIDNLGKKWYEEKNSKKTAEKSYTQPESDSIGTSVDTDKLIEVINELGNSSNRNIKGGGKHKMMGYRNINLSEQSESSIGGFNENSNSDVSENGIMTDDYNAFYNESEFGGVNNELSRMMSRQRDNLHQQVLDTIMSMLNKGELVKDSEPIPATERNAKLIKAYIYRKVSEKNPQMGGLDKILSISKMSEQQIADMVSSMPGLDELEKTIQKNIEEKQSSKPKDKKDKSKGKRQDSSDIESTLDLSMSETDTDKPKKKKSSKTTTKTTKTKKASKTTKKSSKK